MVYVQKRITSETIYIYCLIVVPIFFLPLVLDVFNTPKVWVLTSLTLGFVLLRLLEKRSFQMPTQKFVLVILISLISLSLGMIANSFYSSTTLSRSIWGLPGRANGLAYFLSVFVLLFLIICTKHEKPFIKKAYDSILIPLCVNIAYCTVQYFQIDPVKWTNPYNPIIGTLGNPNFAAALLGISAVYFLIRTCYEQSNLRVAYILLCLASIFLSIKSEAIQGPLTAFIGVLLLFSRFAFTKFSKSKFIALVAAMVAFLSFIFISLVGLGPLGQQLQQYTLNLRFQYWLMAIKMALRNPFLGVGADSYFEGYLRNRTATFVATYSENLRVDAAHSAPLNLLACYGFLIFSLYIMLALSISIIAIRIIYSKISRPAFETNLAVIWLITLIQSMFSLEQVGLGTFQWLIGGLVIVIWMRTETNGYNINSETSKSYKQRGQMGPRKLEFQEFRGELSFIFILLSLLLMSTPIQDELRLKRIISSPAMTAEDIKYAKAQIENLSWVTKMEYRRYSFVSNFYLRINDVTSAEDSLKQVLNYDKESVDTLSQLARIENFRKNYRKEIYYRKQILVLDPNGYSNILSLAKSSVIIEDLINARKYAMLIVENSESLPEFDSATAILRGLPS
jgi:O-Antigen ligase